MLSPAHAADAWRRLLGAMPAPSTTYVVCMRGEPQCGDGRHARHMHRSSRCSLPAGDVDGDRAKRQLESLCVPQLEAHVRERSATPRDVKIARGRSSNVPKYALSGCQRVHQTDCLPWCHHVTAEVSRGRHSGAHKARRS